jgi:hypothetical protein
VADFNAPRTAVRRNIFFTGQTRSLPGERDHPNRGGRLWTAILCTMSNLPLSPCVGETGIPWQTTTVGIGRNQLPMSWGRMAKNLSVGPLLVDSARLKEGRSLRNEALGVRYATHESGSHGAKRLRRAYL